VRKTSIIKTIERASRYLTIFLLVPKIMGNGPIIIAPPPLMLSSLVSDEKCIRNRARKIAAKPVRISTSPSVVKESE